MRRDDATLSICDCNIRSLAVTSNASSLSFLLSKVVFSPSSTLTPTASSSSSMYCMQDFLTTTLLSEESNTKSSSTKCWLSFMLFWLMTVLFAVGNMPQRSVELLGVNVSLETKVMSEEEFKMLLVLLLVAVA